jgi:PPOX class probable F420-dependent enzyme
MPDMTRAEAVEFLAAGTRPGKLATCAYGRSASSRAEAHGRSASSRAEVPSPHVAPIWFVVDGDDLVFTTGERTVKGRSLLADPRAALCVDTDVFPYSFVIVRGPVTLDRAAPDLVEWSTRIAARYVPADKAQWYGERNGVPGEMLCRLRMHRVIAERDIAL